MAENNCPPSERKRVKKSNFSKEEELLIQSEVEKHYQLLTSKHNNVVTNEKKKKIWQEIAQKTSALGVSVRTVKEVKDKWSNAKKIAKKTFTESRKEANKTGGGPQPKQISQAVANIINLCKDSASFKGLDGEETFVLGVNMNASSTEASLPYENASQDLFQTAGTSTPLMSHRTRSPTPPPTSPSSEAVSENETVLSKCYREEAPTVGDRASMPQPGPSKQREPLRSVKRKQKLKIKPDDVYAIQYEVYQAELKRQKKEMEKLELQVELLKNLNNTITRTNELPRTPSLLAANLFASMY